MSAPRILVAGIGNVFFGDDGFGVEVVRELARQALPANVEARDFGIRGYDLAFALSERIDAAILVDAAPRGGTPGSVYLLQVELASEMPSAAPDAHSPDPASALRLAAQIGALPGRLYLVGCEPHDLGGEHGRMGLSDAVAAAVPQACEAIRGLLAVLRAEDFPAGPFATTPAGCAPA